MVFLVERAPPLVFGLLAAGPCFSGLAQVEGFVDIEKLVWAFIAELVGVPIVYTFELVGVAIVYHIRISSTPTSVPN